MIGVEPCGVCGRRAEVEPFTDTKAREVPRIVRACATCRRRLDDGRGQPKPAPAPVEPADLDDDPDHLDLAATMVEGYVVETSNDGAWVLDAHGDVVATVNTSNAVTHIAVGAPFESEVIRLARRAMGRRWQEHAETRAERAQALIVKLAETPRSYAFPDSGGATVHIVAPDPAEPTKWRHTMWDAIGARGHYTRATFAAACTSARELDAVITRAVPVDPSNADAVMLQLGVAIGLELPLTDGEHRRALAHLDAIVARVQAAHGGTP